ncbi:UDP-N-acetylmuramate dehydrogenase [Ectothiorhodospiraceae bacterium BW-2]|nr:UDP-N-acetylmuramate dehydrogenase [Ectothiorhodospiraceae bacterium BW-2]
MSLAAGDRLRGELRYQVPLCDYTSWRVGGAARRWYRPADRDDLATFLAALPADEPLLWLGLGSNLLVRDGGFNGTVIALQGGVDRLEQCRGEQVMVEAGVPLAKLARFAAHRGLGGLSFMGSIPGTVGGALAMNAGCFGSETWSLVRQVVMMNRRGESIERGVAEFDIGYRRVLPKVADEWFIAALMQGVQSDKEQLKQEIKALWQRRGATQPTRWPNAGSVFRNPEGEYAARLIEAAGLKGLRMGGAMVSPQHANFIINLGGATATEIETLIGEVQQRVAQQFGLLLEPEVRVIGDPRAAPQREVA